MISSFSSLGVFIALCFLVAILVYAAYSDLKERRIPNQVILIGLAGAATLAASGGLFVLSVAAVSLVVALLIFLPIYFFGWLGAGDIKLIALVTSFFGLQQIVPIALFIVLAGGLLSLTYLWLSRLGFVEPRVPYAVAICVGVMAHLLFYFE
jgi:prepilin peptidase CpaA